MSTGESPTQHAAQPRQANPLAYQVRANLNRPSDPVQLREAIKSLGKLGLTEFDISVALRIDHIAVRGLIEFEE